MILIAISLYVLIAFTIAIIIGQSFRRQNERRDPFIICRSCIAKNECRAADLNVCPLVDEGV